MVIYSHSRLSTFEQCPLKFKFRYIDKIEPDIKQTIEGFLGNRVHDVLEWIYSQENKEKTLDLDEVIHYYINNWKENFGSEIKIVRPEYNFDYYYDLGIKFLINYFMKNSPFKDNTIATEKKVIVKLDKEGEYFLQGYIDRLVYNEESRIFEIHDYKTSGFLKSQEELDKDRQLALYSIAIREDFPQAIDVHLIWHFLAFNHKIISKRSLEQLEKLKTEIINLIKKIESATEFPANSSLLCNWCEFRSSCYLFNGNNENHIEQRSD